MREKARKPRNYAGFGSFCIDSAERLLDFGGMGPFPRHAAHRIRGSAGFLKQAQDRFKALNCQAYMPRRRSLHRCLTAVLVVISLLFSQLALARYVCPGVPDAKAMAEMMAAGEPCEGMDAVQPVLCHQHSADMSLSFEPVKVATPSLPAVLHVLVLPLLLVSEGRLLPPQVQPDQRPPPDPVYLETRRLRV
jgi:hypothetical protein